MLTEVPIGLLMVMLDLLLAIPVTTCQVECPLVGPWLLMLQWMSFVWIPLVGKSFDACWLGISCHSWAVHSVVIGVSVPATAGDECSISCLNNGCCIDSQQSLWCLQLLIDVCSYWLERQVTVQKVSLIVDVKCHSCAMALWLACAIKWCCTETEDMSGICNLCACVGPWVSLDLSIDARMSLMIHWSNGWLIDVIVSLDLWWWTSTMVQAGHNEVID